MAEEWNLQVSYKTPAGDMINVRAKTPDELSVLLEGIEGYATQVAAVQARIVGAYNVSPLSTTPSTPSTMPPLSSTPPQAQTPSSMGAPVSQAPASGPTCTHGPRKYKSGISQKTGNPYAMWVCPMPQGAEQCKPVN